MIFSRILLSFLFIFNCFSYSPPFNFDEEIHWNWNDIDTSKLVFPKNFLWGVGTSEYQVSGRENCPNANWAFHEDKKNFFGCTTIARGEKSGKACDHWNLYKKDIELMQEVGVNAYRFSIEWSCIEPKEGEFNEQAIKHYHDLIDALLAKKIQPMITLHHFTHPQWFEEKGAFEKSDNIQYFVRFCKRMFVEYSSKINFWLTINEPGVLVFQGYHRAVYPPQKNNFHLAGIVTKNLMKAHIEVYKALKALPDGDKAQIGIVHDIVQFEPYFKGDKLAKFILHYMNLIFHEAITDFLVTKKLNFKIPIFANVEFELADKNEKILDFIGLNYYSHVLWKPTNPLGSSYREGDIPTDMPYGIYAEGFYRAIASVARMGVPIYITENGLADSKDDRREIFLKKYLYTLSKAINDGYDIRGYFYWSLIDNFEWDYGFEKRYGLYEVDYNTFERKQRKSAQYYIKVLKDYFSSLN